MGVINDEGQVNFTERGDLKVNAENQLVLGSGKLVASDGGDPIVLPPNQIISISEEGRVYALDPHTGGGRASRGRADYVARRQ